MPAINHVIASPIERTFRVAQIEGMFDLDANERCERRWMGNLDIDDRDWQIGVIVGPSGSGKSQIAAHVFGEAFLFTGFDWGTGSILDAFPDDNTIQEITAALSSVGFSSPPEWLRSYGCLSTGQKMRADLARCILMREKTIVFDEFTSVVDRTVAQICSAALAKAVRRDATRRFVAVSCHEDILPWLCPDWIFNVGTMTTEWRHLQRRPDIRLDIRRGASSEWQLFRQHHYLSAQLLRNARVYIGEIDGRPVAFCATRHHFGSIKARREHRLVVLPDFQGVGIGNRLSEHIATMERREGRYLSQTSHPAMIAHRIRSPLWKTLRAPGRCSSPGRYAKERLKKSSRSRGITASFEFVDLQGSLRETPL